MIVSFIGAFLGILWVAGCAHALDNQLHEHLLVASLGATAVLLYGVMESKLAQPRNVIGTSDISGSFVSAQVICLCCHLRDRAIVQMAAQLISSAASESCNRGRGSSVLLIPASLHCILDSVKSSRISCIAAT